MIYEEELHGKSQTFPKDQDPLARNSQPENPITHQNDLDRKSNRNDKFPNLSIFKNKSCSSNFSGKSDLEIPQSQYDLHINNFSMNNDNFFANLKLTSSESLDQPFLDSKKDLTLFQPCSIENKKRKKNSKKQSYLRKRSSQEIENEGEESKNSDPNTENLFNKHLKTVHKIILCFFGFNTQSESIKSGLHSLPYFFVQILVFIFQNQHPNEELPKIDFKIFFEGAYLGEKQIENKKTKSKNLKSCQFFSELKNPKIAETKSKMPKKPKSYQNLIFRPENSKLKQNRILSDKEILRNILTIKTPESVLKKLDFATLREAETDNLKLNSTQTIYPFIMDSLKSFLEKVKNSKCHPCCSWHIFFKETLDLRQELRQTSQSNEDFQNKDFRNEDVNAILGKKNSEKDLERIEDSGSNDENVKKNFKYQLSPIKKFNLKPEEPPKQTALIPNSNLLPPPEIIEILNRPGKKKQKKIKWNERLKKLLKIPEFKKLMENFLNKKISYDSEKNKFNSCYKFNKNSECFGNLLYKSISKFLNFDMWQSIFEPEITSSNLNLLRLLTLIKNFAYVDEFCENIRKAFLNDKILLGNYNMINKDLSEKKSGQRFSKKESGLKRRKV